MKNKTKSKTFLIIIVFAVVIILIAVGVYVLLNPKNKTYITINYSELQELINEGDRFILFIGSDDCSHCTIFKSTVNQVVEKYGITINYINVAELSDSESSFISSHLSYSGTPTTILIEAGTEPVEDRVLTKIKGAKKYSNFISTLEKYDFIEN